MTIEEKYKQDILDELTPSDKFNEITAKLNLSSKKEKKTIMKKGLIIGLSIAGVCVVTAGVATGIILTNKPQQAYASGVVVMDVNPSIAFTMDENGLVTSVTGNNEEGEVIIAGEDIVGKNIEDAISLVLTVETETGFLVSGNATVKENNIGFTINIDEEKYKGVTENLQKKITSTVDDTCKKLNVKQNVDYKKYADDEFNKLVASCDPTLSEDQINALTYEEKVNVIKLYSLETASMYSQEIEDLYNQVKYYEFDFADQEYTKTLISNLSGSYALLYKAISTTLDGAITTLQASIDQINQARYDLFVKDDSVYQKTYDSFMEYKENVLVYRNQIANIEDAEARTKLESLLDTAETNLNTVQASLETSKQTGIASLDAAASSINLAINTINTIKGKVLTSDALNELLNEHSEEYQTYLNNKKATILNEFETKYASDIQASKDEALAYKAELKDKVNAAKNKQQSERV